PVPRASPRATVGTGVIAVRVKVVGVAVTAVAETVVVAANAATVAHAVKAASVTNVRAAGAKTGRSRNSRQLSSPATRINPKFDHPT
ncbi:MAG TPA: hypothetical protein VEY69_16360, partial [Lautropia sp.]|nr:hypothetical protein [Lautropia sp.]